MKALNTLPFLLLLTLMSPLIIPSMAVDHRWHSSVEKSDESRPTMIGYTELDVFYQDDYLDFQIYEEIDGYDEVNIQVENGYFGVKDDYHGYDYYDHYYDYYYYGEDGPVNILDSGFFMGQLYGYYLKPYEFDENFNLTLRLEIIDEGESVYLETHTFYVVGEPIVIPGNNINEGLPILEYVLLSITVSIIFWIIVYIIYIRIKKQRGDNH